MGKKECLGSEKDWDVYTNPLCEIDNYKHKAIHEKGRVKRIWYSSPMQAVSQEEPSDRKPDPWHLWMAGHAQLKFVKTQNRLTGLKTISEWI